MGMSEAFPDAVKIKTLKDLRAMIKNLPNDMEVRGFYDDAFGQGIVLVQVVLYDSSDPLYHNFWYLAVDVEEQERT